MINKYLMAKVTNLFCAMHWFQRKRTFGLWSCPHQDEVWCHLANSRESVAQFKEPATDPIPAKFE